VSELAKRPAIEAKVIAEIDEITKGDPDYGEARAFAGSVAQPSLFPPPPPQHQDLQYVDLLTMPYITQVIKETLRVYPPMPVTVRNSLKDGSLGPYRMQKDDIVLVGALAAQNDPKYWGDKPEVFGPEHFTPSKIAGRHPLAFIPFSVGQRQCMAQEVTFMMLRIGVFYVYNAYRLRMASGTTVVRRPIVTNTPVSVKVVREPREGKEQRVAALKAAAEAMAATAAAAASKARGVTVGGSVDDSSTDVWDMPSAIPVISDYRHIVFAFGSNFGSCRRLAELMAERSGKYGFTSDVITLDRLTELSEQVKPWLLVVCASTYTGNPPSNAVIFKNWLDKTEKGCKTWTNCKFLVWALGNLQWTAFLRFPTYVHNRLSHLGGTALAPLGSADVGNPMWENSFNDWQQKIWPILIHLAGAKPSEAAALKFMVEQAKNKTATSDGEVGKALAEGEILSPTILTSGVGTETKVGTVLVARQLCGQQAPTQTRHIEIELPSGSEYKGGDHLGVCPQNDAYLVERIAQRFGVPLEGVFRLPAQARMSATAIKPGTVLQVRNVLTQALDLSGPIPLELVTAMMEATQDPTDRAKLTELKTVLTAGNTKSPSRMGTLVAQRVGILGLLEAFPDVKLQFLPFLQALRPLKPRYYSISSNPLAHGTGTAHITVGLLSEPLMEQSGEQVFRGLSSSYLHNLNVGAKINLFVSLAEGFHLHADLSKPTIMVSAGTGFAPMRAFLHELKQLRHKSPNKLGEVALFNGIRREQDDYIYKEELQQFVQEGVLNHLHVAKSREDPNKRQYVQHVIVKQADLVHRLLQMGGYVYICGSERMRADVRVAFVEVAMKKQGLNKAHAEAYLEKLESDEHRYNPDIWG